jgi:hypothetical protein
MTAYLVVGVALIALGIGVKQGLFGSAARAAFNRTSQPVAAAAPVLSPGEPVAPNSQPAQELRPSNNARSGQPREFSSGGIQLSGPESSAPTATPRRTDRVAPQILSPLDTEASNPSDVIGRPFPVSASVEAERTSCVARGSTDVGVCDVVQRLLLKMAQEPRDPLWATDMEAKLRQHLTTTEQGTLSIRTIECRTSLCAVEVASLSGPYFGNLDSNAFLHESLFTWMATHGYEPDPSGASITVTLITFERR